MHHGDITADIAQGLLELQKRIKAAKIPPSKLDETITLATWNVREFGKKRRRAASLHHIAEIIGQFDLVCLVELRDDVSDLATVMEYLGPYWRVVFSDYLADPGGNRERVGFVYDERAVQFTGLASHAFGPRKKKGAEYVEEISWWRPPYLASFCAGNFDFVLLGAHIRWGETEEGRVPELEKLAEWVASRLKEKFIYEKDIIVVGDFNIPSVKSALYDAVTKQGLRMPKALMGATGSDLQKSKRYDQILHCPNVADAFTNNGGVLDFYDGDHRPLFPGGPAMTKTEFTFQISDHLPLWIEISTDNDAHKLEQILNRKRK